MSEEFREYYYDLLWMRSAQTYFKCGDSLYCRTRSDCFESYHSSCMDVMWEYWIGAVE